MPLGGRVLLQDCRDGFFFSSCKIIVSLTNSVVRSARTCLVIVALLLVISTNPELFPSVKSDPLDDPKFFQYNLVPFIMLSVLTV